jgi:alpha-D-xyloside xylohydrolase
MARRPRWRSLERDPSPVRFRAVRARGRGLRSLRLLSRQTSVGLSILSERPRELTLRFGPVRSRSGPVGAGVVRRRARMGELEVLLTGAPVSLSVVRRGEVVFETATELPPGKLPGPSPWGSSNSGVSLPLRFVPGERVLGAGEFFGPVDRIGQELRTSVRDVYGLPNDGTYVTYPFFWSTRGYGFLAETWAPVRLDFGRRYVGLGEVEVPRTPVTIRLFFSRSPREIIRWFWDRRGAPGIPPPWSYGVWYSRCAYRNQRELLRVARKIRALGLPGDVVHLDPPWLDQPLPDALYAVGRRLGLSRTAVDRSANRDPGDVLAGLAGAAARRGWSLPFFGVGCTFRWNHRRFPDPPGMIRELHERHLRLSLWINPYVPAHTPEFRYLRSRDWFVRRPDGRVGLQFDGSSVDFGGVDFSQPGGRRWFAERIAELVRLGVDVIKTDFGEAVPEDGYGGRIGAPELHNRYATLYPETVFRAVRGAGGDPMVWGRSGGLDIHRYPVQWGGDPGTQARDMAAALRGALSYAASGGAFTAFDSGGFGGRPSAELYVRWMQMGMLFSHTRLHGTTPREPWTFGRRALRIFRKFAALRYRLVPYLYSQSVEGVRIGRPLVRPIALDYPDDPAAAVEDEYLLGEHLLVAPVIPGARSEVVLPRGEWYDFWTGDRVAGTLPSRRRFPLDSLPAYVRSGAVIPMSARDHDHVDVSMLHHLTLRTYGPVETVRLDFGVYGRLRVPELGRRRGRSGPFRWTVERFDSRQGTN